MTAHHYGANVNAEQKTQIKEPRKPKLYYVITSESSPSSTQRSQLKLLLPLGKI